MVARRPTKSCRSDRYLIAIINKTLNCLCIRASSYSVRASPSILFIFKIKH